MADADDAHKAPLMNARSANQQLELEEKARELAEFRDAGVLTEAEVEEQMAKFRWNLP